MRLIFLGPPGVGKGTHAEIVGKRYGIPKISTGDLLRDEIKNGTDLGKKAKAYMDKGGLVPDGLVMNVLKKRIGLPDCRKGFILDGFPRSIPQAEALEGMASVDLVVNSVASENTILERITNRWTCRKCSAIFNTLFIPPKVEGICDVCGGELYQREDQKESVVRERLKVYNEQTAPLIEYYRGKGVLIDVNAEGEKDDVAKRMEKAIEKALRKKGET